MVDMAQTRFPEDMTATARYPRPESLESYGHEAVEKVKQYAREEPMTFALWALGIGFVLGWKLKPW